MLEEISLSGMKDAEVYITKYKILRSEIDDSKLKWLSAGTESYVAVRVVRDGKVGFYSTTLDETKDLGKVVKELYERAEKVSRVSKKVEWWPGFPSTRCSPVPGTFSKSLASNDLDFVLDITKRIIELADEELNVMGSVGLEVSKWAVVNTEGGEYEEDETRVEAFVAASKRVNGYLTKAVSDVYVSRTSPPDVDAFAEKVFEEAKTLELRPERITGEYLVYFDPRAVAELLEFLAEAFYANNVVRGKSPLSGRLGEQAFNEDFTLSDNPTLPGGPESHGCDEEGIKSEPYVLVDEGRVNAFLGDLYWGSKLGFVGRGYRSSPAQPPSPSYTNLTLHAREGAEGEVLVAGLTGLHTATPETGDMSVVLSPAWKDGKHVEAVMSVNVYDLFGELLEGVDRNGRWVGSIFAPGVAARVKLT